MSDRKRNNLEESEEYQFYQLIFRRIPGEAFAVLYSEQGSRPNAPINTMVGALILQHQRGWTSAELLDDIDYDLQTRTALGLWDLDTTPFSRATLFNFQNRLAAHWVRTGENLLERVYAEHFTAVAEQVEVRPAETLGSDSLQSPDDPDATYRTKGAQESRGQVIHVAETCHPDNQLHLITDVAVAPNNTDDSTILADRVEAMPHKQLKVRGTCATETYAVLRAIGVNFGRISRLLTDPDIEMTLEKLQPRVAGVIYQMFRHCWQVFTGFWGIQRLFWKIYPHRALGVFRRDS